MSWWNPFSTESGDGKTTEELDAARAQLDAERAARKEQQARELEQQGHGDEAESVRQAQAEWTRQHNDNLAREAASLEETPWDAFTTELDERASALGGAGDRAFGTILKTIFSAVPWFVWLGLAAYVAWQFGLFKKLIPSR